MRNLIAAMFFTTVSALGRGEAFQGLDYSTSGEVVPGRWTAQYSKAKAVAKSAEAPLVAVWVRPSCGYCQSLGSALAGSSVAKWAGQRGYYLVIGVEDTTDEEVAVKSYARNSSGLFPYVGIWWPRKSGEVKGWFSGRSGTMPIAVGSIAQRFMDSVDKYVGAYADVPPKYSDVTFNANGGTISASDKTRSVAIGKTVGMLPSVSRGGYRLLGWFTGASGGDRVLSSTVIAKPVTFYAHWAKVYSLSVSCSPKEGGSVSGAGPFAEGESFALKAKAASGYVFAGWDSAKEKGFSQETTYRGEMGSVNLSLTAKFIKKTDDTVVIGAFKTAAEYETGKEIVPIALSATGGSLPALSATKLPSGLKFTAKAIAGHAANTIYGMPTKSGIYTVQVSAKTAGGAKASASLPLIVRAKNERIVSVSCDPSMGKVSGGGVFADGKKASVRATALSKHCFTGWSIGGTLVSRSASFSYPVDGKDETLVAGFVPKEQDLASVSLAVGGIGQLTTQIQTNIVRCGVSTNWTVVAKALSGTTVSASGLPAGMKLVRTLVDKELKEYAYEIAGVPSAASKVDSKTMTVRPSVATVKVTTLGKSSASYKIAFVVEALPVWAYGNFSGFAAADETGKGVGVATMTVSSGGRISGKFGLFGTNWTYSVTGYGRYDDSEDPAKMHFAFDGVAKYSKWQRPIAVELSPGVLNCSVADGAGEDFAFVAYRNVWGDRPAPESPKRAKAELEPPEGFARLAMGVSSGGKATFSGKTDDGSSVSVSSTVFVDADGARRAFLVVPASRKGEGRLVTIEIK